PLIIPYWFNVKIAQLGKPFPLAIVTFLPAACACYFVPLIIPYWFNVKIAQLGKPFPLAIVTFLPAACAC
ncbi:hypothetical protein, partial [Salmonella enterica]|uniref:hypothetical protein n=1 Tax=Salmonella enterica TaxID=28901 RepID=UPI002FCD79BA